MPISTCYILIALAATACVVWGLMDILKKRLPTEDSDGEVISRQIRGFGILLLSQVLLILGGAICLGMSGSVDGFVTEFGQYV